jgi:hypothetical protein
MGVEHPDGGHALLSVRPTNRGGRQIIFALSEAFRQGREIKLQRVDQPSVVLISDRSLSSDLEAW